MQWGRVPYFLKVRFCYFVNVHLLRLLRPVLVSSTGLTLEKLGSDYGGWVVPVDMIERDWICYCVGVGEDITFDLAIINRFGVNVYAFDPTPRAVRYVKEAMSGLPESFHFQDIGLWSSDATLRFYAPDNPNYVSHSIVNLCQTQTYFEAPCKKLSSIMRDLGHERIDLLKLDIEGAEFEVLRNILEERLNIQVLCVEYDQPVPFHRIIGSIWQLIHAGYRLICIDRFNLTFCRSGPAPKAMVDH